MTFENRSDEELIEEFKSTYDVVNNSDCFGANDLRLLALAGQELVRRGYHVRSTSTFVVEVLKKEG